MEEERGREGSIAEQTGEEERGAYEKRGDKRREEGTIRGDRKDKRGEGCTAEQTGKEERGGEHMRREGIRGEKRRP